MKAAAGWAHCVAITGFFPTYCKFKIQYLIGVLRFYLLLEWDHEGGVVTILFRFCINAFKYNLEKI